MLDTIILADGEPDRLLATLASLIPAIPEGVVGQGWILDPDERMEVRRIADAAGCHFTADLPGAACESWRLLICAGAVLEDGWWREAMAFCDRMRLVENDRRFPAVFTYADRNFGVAPRLREIAAIARRSVPFLPVNHRAVVLPPASGKAEISRTAKSMMRVGGPVETLRARIYA
jgi:hypothetical protein